MLPVATHLFSAGSFGILTALILARREKTSVGIVFLAACLVTILWALSNALGEAVPRTVTLVAEDCRGVAWLVFLDTLLVPQKTPWRDILKQNPLVIVIAAVFVLAVVSDGYGVTTASRLNQFEILSRIGIAILGLYMIENLYRQTPVDQRWHIKPATIAFGAIFAFDLYLYSDRLLFRTVDQSLLSARAIVNGLVVPFLALAVARNKNWRMRIRVSRNVAFHGITLVASGVFLLSVALVGTLFRRYGGDWSVVLQVTLLFGSMIVLAAALSTTTWRQQIRHYVLKNFFPYRYDYRVEWNSFIEALSSPNEAGDLPERIVHAVARIVGSRGGVLFHRQNGVFLPTSYWNARVASDAREAEDSEFILNFQGGDWIQVLDEAPESVGWRHGGVFSIAVPLTHRGQLIGFVMLLKPVGPFAMDWEVFEVLRTVGRQAASYLAEHDAAQALVDARLLQEYSKRFAFVVHDIKNLSSQLALVVSNARRHGNDPEFLSDAWKTIENSVDRMTALLSQLRDRQNSTDLPTDVATIVRDLVAHHPASGRIRLSCSDTETWARIDSERLRSALTHLIDNALEASDSIGQVAVALLNENDGVVIKVSDEGFGMDTQFVRNQLFRPFRSTKGGYGIGAYQTRDLIQSAGGQIQVISAPGTGTTMKVTLVPAEAPAARVA